MRKTFRIYLGIPEAFPREKWYNGSMTVTSLTEVRIRFTDHQGTITEYWLEVGTLLPVLFERERIGVFEVMEIKNSTNGGAPRQEG